MRDDVEILISRNLCSVQFEIPNTQPLKMLQWMGGSRRKVAAGIQSHTSLKKRQKQYFEQRRQQQNQLRIGSDSCTNDINSTSQHPVEHQSLDILNMLNLATATPECKPSRPEGGREDLDVGFYKPKDNISGVGKSPNSLIMIHGRWDDAGSSSNHKVEPISSKRSSFSLPDIQTNDFKKANTTTDLLGGSEQKLSVFDLVGDDYTTTNLEECSPSEAHIAFSVEGIGPVVWRSQKGLDKINTRTPDNSPRASDKTFVYRCPSPWKDTGQPDISNVTERLNDFEREADSIIKSSKMFQDDNRYGFPAVIHSKDGGRKQQLRYVSDHSHKQASKSRSNFCATKYFNNSRFSDDLWNDKSAFLDDGEDNFYGKGEQPCQKESLNPDFLRYRNDYNQNLSSADHHRKKKRDYLQTTWRSDIRDSPTRGSHLRESSVDHSTFTKTAFSKTPEFDFDNVFEQPVWSSIVPEKDRDSHSLLSEESCSSSAVWTNETPISQFKTNPRQRKTEVDSFCNVGNKKYLNNGLLQESWEDLDMDDRHLQKIVGSGNQVRLPNPGNSKLSSQREDGIHKPYNWFAEEFTSVGISSDITTERHKPYSFVNPEVGSSHWLPSRTPDYNLETWVPKFSVGGNEDYDDDEGDYVNCLTANHKSKLAGDICSFDNATLSENDNEQSREVNLPQNQGDETSSSIAKSLSDENEWNPKEQVIIRVCGAARSSNQDDRSDRFA